MRTFLIDENTSIINLGYRQENEYQQVVYTYPSDWEGGTINVFIRRPTETESYPLANVVRDESAGTVTFTVTDTDLHFAGWGAVEFQYLVDDVVAKSMVYRAIISTDIISAEGEAPSGYDDWIASLTALASTTTENANAAANSATNAANSAAAAAASAATASAAMVHAPIIANGYWYVWNTTTGVYESTGVEAQGETGETGNGISSVSLTGQSGTNPVVDEYTITYTDGTTTTFTVTNGRKGDTGATGATGATGNGIASITKTATVGLVDTYTITFTDGTTATFTVTNGNDAKTILKSVMPTDTAQGSIASFSDGTDVLPAKSVTVAIEPVQSGSGTPSPNNIRPISGWGSVGVTVAGKNLFGGTLEQGTFTNQGIGSASNTRIRTDFVKVPSGSIAISTPTASTYIHEVYCYDANKDFTTRVSGGIGASSGVVTVPSGSEYIRFSVRYSDNSTITPSDGVKIQVEVGTTATTYEPYNATTTTLTLPQTVYGGSLDVGTGEVTVTYGIVDLGTLDWITLSNYVQTNALVGLVAPPANNSTVCDIIAEQYIASKWAATASNGVGISASGIMAIVTTNTPSGKLVYKLATPLTLTLTAQDIDTLLGDNNVWSDAGDVDITYYADIQKYIAKKLAE